MSHDLSERQAATTLAALRLYQAIADGVSPFEALLAVDDIATNCGQVDSLTSKEIDELCEDINFSD